MAERKPCTSEGCDKPVQARGLCNTHYRRWHKAGGAATPRDLPTEARFWSHVEKTETCWTWTASTRLGGYGQFNPGTGVPIGAHRYSYGLVNGDVPDSLVIDHICHNPLCVRPDHLRAVSPKQNIENRAGANRNSKSGVRGVWWWEARKCWVARMKHNWKSIHVGYFATLEEAEAAVIAKRNELFTHNDADRWPDVSA